MTVLRFSAPMQRYVHARSKEEGRQHIFCTWGAVRDLMQQAFKKMTGVRGERLELPTFSV